MLNLIIDSYKSFFKKLPVMLLFIIPLLVYCYAELYMEGRFAHSMAFVYVSVVLTALFNVLTEISLYKYNLSQDSYNPLKPWYNIFIYYVAQMLFGLILALPAWLFIYILNKLGVPYAALLGWTINIFIGIALWARLNVLLPMVIAGKKVTAADFFKKTSASYLQWLAAAVFIYLPYIAINFLVNNPWLNAVLLNIAMILIIVFNTNYMRSIYKPGAKKK